METILFKPKDVYSSEGSIERKAVATADTHMGQNQPSPLLSQSVFEGNTSPLERGCRTHGIYPLYS